jgi:hypothetical protein
MAVLFDLPRLGGKDWYKWGAEILLKNQLPDGSWRGAYAQGGPDTCFALLFLKRANLAADLTDRIKKAPGAVKLLEGITEGDKSKSERALPPRGPEKQSRLDPTGDPDRRRPGLLGAKPPETDNGLRPVGSLSAAGRTPFGWSGGRPGTLTWEGLR